MKEPPKDEFKERAYEILYQKYRNAFMKQVSESINLQNLPGLEQGDDQANIERKVEKFNSIGNLEKWSYYGIMSQEDIAVIKTLEYCLGEKYGIHQNTK
ncbi:hypothetical protein HOD29_06215 [archaeon]|jgi:hypothetical protein|nr:hypothetical protein [archaeon]